ncbi:HNH endonuclease [Cryobacterium sp. BB736]|uniref:HNH endonuclease n=1 Tax=Cryobacterium sp. BB736 TaxID=2746963 RepID=UPI0018762A0C|nr:HNH endonuclease [Cryobacterium sp. BB736]
MQEQGYSLWIENLWVARRLASIRFEGDCIIWTGRTNNMGYGIVSQNNKSFPAHRWFFERFVSPVPKHLFLDHLCRTPLCVNPKHLEPVTQLENDRRGLVARGYGPDRKFCANGHPWVPENLALQKGAPNVLWNSYKCRPCDAELHRKKGGHMPRGTRTRAEANAALAKRKVA